MGGENKRSIDDKDKCHVFSHTLFLDFSLYGNKQITKQTYRENILAHDKPAVCCHPWISFSYLQFKSQGFEYWLFPCLVQDHIDHIDKSSPNPVKTLIIREDFRDVQIVKTSCIFVFTSYVAYERRNCLFGRLVWL